MNPLTVHQWIYSRSGGRIGHRLIGVPCLLLRTTGRKSGAVRTSALVYAQDGASYVVVASNGGADRPPGWLFNIQAEPRVEIQVGTVTQSATASVVKVTEDEYPRLWKAVNDNNHGRYDGYQAKTSRPIPVVVLTPAP
jgi:F420H(2)-dependent quinone reductase